jgi:hypothetical protein
MMGFLQSCDNKNVEVVDPQTYLPLEVGKYQVYEITETTYSPAQPIPLVNTWQEKDVVDRITNEQEHTKTYVINRYKRNNKNDYFQKVKEYTIRQSPDRVITTMDNISILSLVLPPDPKINWNGNMYNIQDNQKNWYTKINEPSDINSISFSHTITVIERNDSTAINNYKGIKQYAAGVGLIYDEQTAYEYCQEVDCIGSGKIDSGFYRIKKIIESN